MKKLGVIAAAVAVTTTTVVTVQGWADGSAATDAVPRQLAYKGTLEKDGAAYSGVMPMTFKLYDGSSSTAAWTEQQTVTVYNGTFQVMLGAASTTSATSLDTLVKYGDDLYLSITLNTTSGDVTLSNKQRFYPVPYAGWATSAADFSVGDDLTVADATELKGTLSVSGTSTFTKKITASSDLQVDGTMSYKGPDWYFSSSTERGDGGRALVHDFNDYLVINYAGDLGNKTDIQSASTTVKSLSASGTLSVTGAATLASTLTLSSNTANIAFSGNGSASTGPSSGGWKMKTYGSESGVGVETSAQWYASSGSHNWYSTGDAGSTFTKRMSLDNTGKLSLTGALNPKEGNGSAYGIQFTENVAGGTGDSAYMRYYVESGENSKLIIANDNDDDDDLVFQQKSAERLQLRAGEIFVLNGTEVSYGSCATNWSLYEGICYRRYSTGKTWLAAQYDCHTQGAHICTMAESYAIWGGSSCSQVHQTNDWLGDLVQDDYPLHVSDRCAQSNFENDDDNKTDSKAYVCCQNLR